MRKGPGSAYDKWNISVVICDTDIFHSGQPNRCDDRDMNFEEIKDKRRLRLTIRASTVIYIL